MQRSRFYFHRTCERIEYIVLNTHQSQGNANLLCSNSTRVICLFFSPPPELRKVLSIQYWIMQWAWYTQYFPELPGKKTTGKSLGWDSNPRHLHRCKDKKTSYSLRLTVGCWGILQQTSWRTNLGICSPIVPLLPLASTQARSEVKLASMFKHNQSFKC